MLKIYRLRTYKISNKMAEKVYTDKILRSTGLSLNQFYNLLFNKELVRVRKCYTKRRRKRHFLTRKMRGKIHR